MGFGGVVLHTERRGAATLRDILEGTLGEADYSSGTAMAWRVSPWADAGEPCELPPLPWRVEGEGAAAMPPRQNSISGESSM